MLAKARAARKPQAGAFVAPHGRRMASAGLDSAGQVCHHFQIVTARGAIMEVCIGYMHGKAVMLELRDGVVFLDNEPQPVKNVTEEELTAFSEAVRAIPYSTDPGYTALVNAKRAAFIVNLLGRAVGDECISRLTHILDHVHYDVLEYLGENGDNDA